MLERFGREFAAVLPIIRTKSIRLGIKRTLDSARYRHPAYKVYEPAANPSNSSGLMPLVDEYGITHSTGTHAIYLHPGKGLDEAMPEMVADFPPSSGFKVLRQPIGRRVDRYHFTKYPIVTSIMSGTLSDNLDAAHRLHDLGIGPAPRGIISIQIGSELYPCFAVSHVDGRKPSVDEYNRFIETLKVHISSKRINFLPWQGLHHDDFGPPDCNGNLMIDPDGNPMYVDFQAFAV